MGVPAEPKSGPVAFLGNQSGSRGVLAVILLFGTTFRSRRKDRTSFWVNLGGLHRWDFVDTHRADCSDNLCSELRFEYYQIVPFPSLVPLDPRRLRGVGLASFKINSG